MELHDYLRHRQDGKPHRIIARSFWGLNTERSSALGFTLEGNRAWFLDQYRTGDLVLIYGAQGVHTASDDQGRILGFLEVDPTPIGENERASPEHVRWLKDKDLEDRWTFKLPIKRAWQCVQNYQLRQVAAYTFGVTEGRQRGSRGVFLSDEEALQVLKLRVKPANVYLEPRVFDNDEPVPSPLFMFFTPSLGLPPSGRVIIEDGPRRLYLSRFAGEARQLLPNYPRVELHGKSIVKIGLAKDPEDRLKGLNGGFPKAAQQFGFKWLAGMQSTREYADYQSAKEVEDVLKAAFDQKFKSLGGEFFLGDWSRMQSEFCALTLHDDVVISASTSAPR